MNKQNDDSSVAVLRGAALKGRTNGSVSDRIRRYFGNADTQRDRSLVTPEDIIRKDSIACGVCQAVCPAGAIYINR